MRLAFAPSIIALIVLASCTPTVPPPIMSSKGAVELRAMETRSFETADRTQTLRSVIATMQDLGYSVDKIEARSGTLTATKLAALTMTATVLPGTGAPTLVRANAMVTLTNQQHQVDDPRFYLDDFFTPLSKALFLDARDVPPAAPTAAPGLAGPGT